MKNFTLIVVLLACLSGCTQLQPLLGGDEQRQVGELLAYVQRAAQLAPDEQKRELAIASQAYARERSPQARLRLALLLAQPGSAVNDDARAATLLEFFATPGTSPVRQLGSLLHAQVGERLREQRRSQQMKDQIDALRAVERNLIERGQSKVR